MVDVGSNSLPYEVLQNFVISKMLVQYPNHEPSQISLHVNCYYIIQSSYDLTKERLVFCLCIFWDLYLPCLIQNSTLNGPQRTGLEIADIKKLKKVCARKRASVSRLTARYKDILKEKDGHQEEEIMAILENVKDKQSDLKKENRDIV